MVLNQRIENINPPNHCSNTQLSSCLYIPSLHANVHSKANTKEKSPIVQKLSGADYTDAQPMAIHGLCMGKQWL